MRKIFWQRMGFQSRRIVRCAASRELQAAIAELGTPCILKTAEFGYDGKGQSRIESIDQAPAAWAALNCPVGVLEGLIRFDKEISVDRRPGRARRDANVRCV